MKQVPKSAVVALLLLLLSGAGYSAWYFKLVPVDQILEKLPFGKSSQAELPALPEMPGLVLNDIEKAIPENALGIFGVRDLPGMTTKFQSTELFKALTHYQSSWTANSFLRSVRDKKGGESKKTEQWSDELKKISGIQDAVLAVYPHTPSSTSPAIVVLTTTLEKDFSEKQLKKMIAQIQGSFKSVRSEKLYSIQNKNKIGFSNSKELLDQAKKNLESSVGAKNILTKVHKKFSDHAKFFYAIDLEKIPQSYLDSYEKLQNYKLPKVQTPKLTSTPFKSVSGSIYEQEGLQFYTWAELKQDTTSYTAFRSPPQISKFPMSLMASEPFWVSSNIPLKTYYNDYKTEYSMVIENLKTKELEFLKQENIEKFLEFTGDETGLIFKGWEASSMVPHFVFYVKAVKRWRLRLALWRSLTEENGWSKEDNLYVKKFDKYKLEVGLILKDGFLILGHKAYVKDLITRLGQAGISIVPKDLKSLNMPEKTSSVSYLNMQKFIDSLLQSPLGTFAKMFSKGKEQAYPVDWTSFFPVSAYYSVNSKDGVFSKGVLTVRKHSYGEWSALFDTFVSYSKKKQKQLSFLKNRSSLQQSQAGEGIPQLSSSPAVSEMMKKMEKTNQLRSAPPSLDFNFQGEQSKIDELDPIVEMLQDESWGVRRDAAFSLGEAGSLKHIAPLKKLLKDPSPEVQKAAQEAIEKLKKK